MVNVPEAPAPRNHNNPPSDIEILDEQLSIRHVHLLRDVDRHADQAKHIPSEFKEQLEADYVSDLIKEMQLLQKTIESTRKEEKEPFLRQGQKVDSYFNEMRDKLQDFISKAQMPLTKWLRARADAEKVEREALAARMRQEARAAAETAAESENTAAVEVAISTQTAAAIATQMAATPVTELSKAQGKFSSAGLKEKWVGTITEPSQLDLNKLRPYINLTALQTALNAYVKAGGRECAGAIIKKEIETKVK